MLALTIAALGLVHEPPTAQTADTGAPHGTIAYRVQNEDGQPMPARLTFIDAEGSTHQMFPNVAAAVTDLAVRRHAVYTLSGKGSITVPIGQWTVLASHGIEWSLDSTQISVTDGSSHEWTANLVHEVDTTDWVSADFHLHTLTYSGHGDSNMNERIISIVGEGLEFAVATDHNHNTDYGPTINTLGAAAHLTAVTGNEISTNYGHFNAFPFDPAAKVVDQRLEAGPLMASVRAEQNKWSIVPIMQVNHPRWPSIDYFGRRSLDPITGESSDSRWSWDFDCVEILNENEGWGYHDAEISDVNTRRSMHSVLEDWFNMLNAGRRIAATGNSDSHAVIATIAGIPRNYLHIGSDDPATIDPIAVADAVRRGEMTTTTGPFVRVTADGQPMGSTITVFDGNVDVHLDIQCASWIKVNRVRIFRNGSVVATLKVDGEQDGPTHLRPRIRIPVPADHDSWIVAIVDGDQDLAPYLTNQSRPILPLSIANPIYVDADGDGIWTAPRDWARDLAATGGLPSAIDAWRDAVPAERVLLALACSEDARDASRAARLALSDDDRRVRLAGMRLAEASGDMELLPLLVAQMNRSDNDRYLSFCAWAAADTLDGDQGSDLLEHYAARHGWSNARRYSGEHALRLPGDFVRDWQVAGYFEATDMDALAHKQAPEPNIVHITAPLTKTGEPLAWSGATADAEGHLDMAAAEIAMCEQSIAYARCWLHSPDDREVEFTIGSDDGCRIWVGDTLSWDDPDYQSASPDANFGTMALQEGWNPVLVKVLNGSQSMGFYMRVLDTSVVASASPPDA